jgi:hypothetical protein
MENNDFYLPELFKKYFGISGNNEASVFGGATFLNKPTEVTRSVFGVPIFEQFTLSAKEDGVAIVDYTFPGWPLLELNCPNRVIKTEVTYNPGTVKEYIGEGDYEISIKGFLINHDQQAIPLDQMTALKNACKAGRTLKITSEVLNGLGVHYVVIENLMFHEVQGSIVAQPFTISAVSDYPYELVIQDTRTLKTSSAKRARDLLLGK